MKKQLVNFQIGRGGRFNNQGHLSFSDVGTRIKENCINENFPDYENNLLFDEMKDEVGELTGGNESYRFEFDGAYDTVYGKLVESFEELDEDEQRAILDSGNKRFFEIAFNTELE